MAKGIIWVATLQFPSPVNPNMMIPYRREFKNERELEQFFGLKRRQPTDVLQGKCQRIAKKMTIQKIRVADGG